MGSSYTSFFIYWWFCLGMFTLFKPGLVLSEVFDAQIQAGEAGHLHRECKVLVQTVGVLMASLSLMTCPSPHGYFMASVALALGSLKFYVFDGVLVGKHALVAVLVVLPLAVSAMAVFGDSHGKPDKKLK